MFRKSRYLDRFPVLGLEPAHLTRYRLRCTRREERLCTAEVAAMCLALAGEERAARALDAWLDVFIERNVDVRATRAANAASPVHERLAAVVRSQLG
jgi:DTW domain-containing protein YfiP